MKVYFSKNIDHYKTQINLSAYLYDTYLWHPIVSDLWQNYLSSSTSNQVMMNNFMLGVNFINILLAVFSHRSVIYYFWFAFVFEICCCHEIGLKAVFQYPSVSNKTKGKNTDKGFQKPRWYVIVIFTSIIQGLRLKMIIFKSFLVTFE